jgi:hypothetical protein
MQSPSVSANSGVFSSLSPRSVVLPVNCSLSKVGLLKCLLIPERDPRRLFEGNALIRRLVRVGVLDESRMKLDYVLALKVEDFLERRLQTQVFKLGLARSIHHSRVLIRQRHIRVGSQVSIPETEADCRLSMFLRLLSVSIRRNTLISHLARRWREVVLGVIVENVQRPQRKVKMLVMRMKSKFERVDQIRLSGSVHRCMLEPST